MAAHQAPSSLGFSRQEHWSGLPFPSPMHESKKWKWSCSVVSDSWRPHGLQPTRLLRPWDFPSKSTGVGCHCLLRCIAHRVAKSQTWLSDFHFHCIERHNRLFILFGFSPAAAGRGPRSSLPCHVCCDRTHGGASGASSAWASRMGPRGPSPRRLSHELRLSPGGHRRSITSSLPLPPSLLLSLCPPNPSEPLRCDWKWAPAVMCKYH